MRVLIQRVSRASVAVDRQVVGEIQEGMLIFLGVTHSDSSTEAEYLARRCADIRIFEDDAGKMNCSVKDIGGKALVISQFTLYGDTRKGNRPSFTDAASPDIAERLYDEFIRCMQTELGNENVKAGIFRAMMDVSLINSGPVTLMIESK